MAGAAELAKWARGQVRKAPARAAKTAQARLADEGADVHAVGNALLAALDEAIRCRRCGRVLKDPVSVARHIGPDCVLRRGAAA